MISRPVAVPALVCMAVLGRALLAGSLTVTAAAGRALVLLAVAWSIDRLVLPLVAEMLKGPERRRDDHDGKAPARS